MDGFTAAPGDTYSTPTAFSPQAGFCALVQYSPDQIAIANAEGVLGYINPAIRFVLGYTPAEWVGYSLKSRVHSEDLSQFKLLWNNALRQPYTPLKAELRFQHHEGEWREFEVVVNNLLDEPNVAGLVVTWHDVDDRIRALQHHERAAIALQQLNAELQAQMEERTAALRDANSHLRQEVVERIQTQKALQESQERFHLAVSGTNDGIWDWDLRTDRVYLSPVWLNIFGYGKSEIPGTFDSYCSHIHPDDLPQVLKDVQMHLDSDIPVYRNVHRIRRKDGQWIWIETKARCVRNETGKPYRLIGTATDISERKHSEAERKQTEEKLRKSESRLMEAQKLAHIGNWEFDVSTQQLTWSEETFHIFGRDPADVEPSYSEFLQQHCPDDRLQLAAAIQQAIQRGVPYELDLWLTRPNGTLCCVAAKADISMDASGTVIRLYGTVLDITERKQAAAKIQTSLDEKELLLKEVHHRVKNNMQVISSIFSLQSQYIQDPKILSILTDSKNRIRSMALIHERLYQSSSLAKIDFGEYIYSLVNHLFASYNTNHDLIHLDLKISDVSLNLDTAIPCGLLINELVSNSLKHAFPNNRSGVISIYFAANAADELALAVHDDGVGLAKEIDLQQTSSLGLRLVRALTRQLGGSLEIGRQPKTTFQVTFPKLH